MNTPLWSPTHPETTQMSHFMQTIANRYGLDRLDYAHLHTWSIEHPALFWASIVDFFHLPFAIDHDHVLENSNDMIHARWFTNVHFNMAEQLLSRDDEHPALISIDEAGSRQVMSYHALRQAVASCAAGLKQAGIVTGDRVGAVLPNVSYTIIAMLAVTSIGAIWSSCSPDFGSTAIIDRLGQLSPRLLFVCDGHHYMGKSYDAKDKIKALCEGIPSLEHVVVCPILSAPLPLISHPKRISWAAFQQPATPLECIPLPFDHPLYILFSSGTTGKPKCIIHGAGGTLLQHLKELALHTDLTSKDILCFYTTCGWMMWNWMVSALALGTTLVLYEGSPTYPYTDRLFDLIDAERITVLGTSPKFLSALDKEGITPKTTHDLTALRCLLSTGAPLLPKHYDFVYQAIKIDLQLSSMSGGTDIISCFALGNPMEPVYRGELQCLGLGMAVTVFDEEGHPTASRGELVCTKPFPSMPIGLWNDPEKKRYQQTYFKRFPGVWTQGDLAELTPSGGLIIYGRSDATLNPGGVRIGTAELYRPIEHIPEVLESIVIGQDWHDDVRIILFVKLRPGLTLTEELEARLKQTIRENTSPRHVPAKILQVQDIPRTLNGKIVEMAVRQTVQGEVVDNMASLANPESLLNFKNRKELGC